MSGNNTRYHRIKQYQEAKTNIFSIKNDKDIKSSESILKSFKVSKEFNGSSRNVLTYNFQSNLLGHSKRTCKVSQKVTS